MGVHISSDLSWSVHIDIITSKARRTLGFVYRKFYRYVNSSVLTNCIPSWFAPCLNVVVLCGTRISKKTLINLSPYKDLRAKSAPRIGLRLTVTNFTLLTFLLLVIADYSSSSAQCTRFLTRPSPSLKT